jgi:hypothetical protein
MLFLAEERERRLALHDQVGQCLALFKQVTVIG